MDPLATASIKGLRPSDELGAQLAIALMGKFEKQIKFTLYQSTFTKVPNSTKLLASALPLQWSASVGARRCQREVGVKIKVLESVLGLWLGSGQDLGRVLGLGLGSVLGLGLGSVLGLGLGSVLGLEFRAMRAMG